MRGSFPPRDIETPHTLPTAPAPDKRAKKDPQMRLGGPQIRLDPQVRLDGPASDAAWSKRLVTQDTRGADAPREPPEKALAVFPPIPYFVLPSGTYFVMQDAFKRRRGDAVRKMEDARKNGVEAARSLKGHWISKHYAVVGGHDVTADSLEPTVGRNAEYVTLQNAAKRAEEEARKDPTSAKNMAAATARRIADREPPWDPFKGASYRPYPRSRGLIPCQYADAIDPKGTDPDHTPDWHYTELYTHVMPIEETHYDVSATALRIVLDAAERADYQFAQRMQGLQNATFEAVWPSSDRCGSERDATAVTDLFIKGYMGNFVARYGRKSEMDGSVLPVEVIREAIHMHSQFTHEWDDAYKRRLAPTLQAGAEAFVGMFSTHQTLKSLPEVPNRWALLSRYFIRNPAHSAIFSVCLHSYMVKMEQDRGARNANYKSMTNAASSYLASMNAMSTFLTQNMAKISGELTRLLTPKHHCLHIFFIDWHWIASELPVGHRRFLPYKEDIDNPDRQEEEADIPQTRMEDDSD